jgi:hypothetical protein
MNTLTKSVFSILFIIVLNTAYAQIQIGITGGIGGATQSGLTIRKSYNDVFAVKTNIMYSLKGSSYDIMEDGKSLKVNDNYKYITLPVKVEYSTPVYNNRMFVAAGPYIGLLLGAKQEVDGISNDINDPNDLDYGLAFELGYSKLLSKRELQLSICYDMGLAKILDYDEDIRNKALCLNFGFLF